MRQVDLIIPTLKRGHVFQCLSNLSCIPWPYRLFLVTEGNTWAEAINIGLKETSGENDVILMDDDVFVTVDSFKSLDAHYLEADIFGFKLLFPNGRIQHAGGFYQDGMIGHIAHGMENHSAFNAPYYVCHATTSLIYIKRHVLDKLKGMAEDIPGVQMEDVDFSFRALKSGFKIMYLPDPAIHMESATKKDFPEFRENIGVAFREIEKRHLRDYDFVSELNSFPKSIKKEVVYA